MRKKTSTSNTQDKIGNKTIFVNIPRAQDVYKRQEALYERNDVRIRELEGMEQGKGFYTMEGLRTDLPGVTEICENGILYEVDYVNGQKTGFFLDQKYNRLAAARLAPGRRVLDCLSLIHI